MASASAFNKGSSRATWLGVFVLVFVLGCAHAGSNHEPPTSLLEVHSDTGDADVWVDGQYIGQVTAVSGRLRLAPGVHRVEIRKPGFFPVQRTVEVDKRGGGSVMVEAEMLTDPR